LSAAKEKTMNDGSLVIPKKRVPVTLWIHPEGRVQGSIFVHMVGNDSTQDEQPSDVINEVADFVVIEREDPGETRFYNKSSIVRLQYQDAVSSPMNEGRPQPCRITMMDGLLIEGEIYKATPVEHSRLYDYMNDTDERFLKLRPGGAEVLLINKSYVVYISAVEVRAHAFHDVDAASGGRLEFVA
jgi:hypothetical protein